MRDESSAASLSEVRSLSRAPRHPARRRRTPAPVHASPVAPARIRVLIERRSGPRRRDKHHGISPPPIRRGQPALEVVVVFKWGNELTRRLDVQRTTQGFPVSSGRHSIKRPPARPRERRRCVVGGRYRRIAVVPPPGEWLHRDLHHLVPSFKARQRLTFMLAKTVRSQLLHIRPRSPGWTRQPGHRDTSRPATPKPSPASRRRDIAGINRVPVRVPGLQCRLPPWDVIEMISPRGRGNTTTQQTLQRRLQRVGTSPTEARAIIAGGMSRTRTPRRVAHGRPGRGSWTAPPCRLSRRRNSA